MNKKSLTFQSYDLNEHEEKTITFPDKLESIYFAYDGGRITLNINGEEVFYTHLGGNDCALTINGDIK